MSSKIIRMQRPAQGELSEIAARLEKELDALHPLFMEFLPLSLEEVFILEMEDRGYAQH